MIRSAAVASCAVVAGAVFGQSLNFEQADVFDFATVAATSYAAAARACGTADRDIQNCRIGPNRQLRLVAFRAQNDRFQFYTKCMLVMRDDQRACDEVLGAFISKAMQP